MKYFLMLVAVLLPHTILCDSSTDNEKYQQSLTPSQSLYCNDLNPQSHLDFNMVNSSVFNVIHTITMNHTINRKFNQLFMQQNLGQFVI